MKGEIVEMYAVVALPSVEDLRVRPKMKLRRELRYVVEYPDGSRKVFTVPM